MNVVNALNREQAEPKRQSPFNRVCFISPKSTWWMLLWDWQHKKQSIIWQLSN